MNRNLVTTIIVVFLTIFTFSQVIDTVYFDKEGGIMINETAEYYRIAKFDTIRGSIIGDFKDYKTKNDSLIAKGHIDKNNEIVTSSFIGNDSYLPIAKKMLQLQASFVRINDYPLLGKFIKPYKTNSERANKNQDFTIIKLKPSFPDGIENLGWFIGQFIKYPEEAEKNNISGVVKVNFLVNRDGHLSDFTILEGLGYGCDEEAIRVLKLTPDWLPGLQRGNPVPVKITLPIAFQ
jgi:TonB family protein